MSIHYVCTGGCLTVRYAPSYCPVAGCPRHRNALTECNCGDNEHGDLLFKNHPDRERAEAAYRSKKAASEVLHASKQKKAEKPSKVPSSRS